MTSEALEQFEERIGYHFRHQLLITQALTHPSYYFEHDSATGDYQRLEFLGDAVLGMLLAEQLYHLHPAADEGTLSRFRAALAGEGSLAAIARSCGYGEFIRLGRGERRSDGSDKDSILADVFEATLAAVYLDGGFDAARQVVTRLLGELLCEPLKAAASGDAKSALQELLSARHLPPPVYVLLEESGPPHDRLFSFAVLCGEATIGTGMGRSKKLAHQAAAADALHSLLNDVAVTE